MSQEVVTHNEELQVSRTLLKDLTVKFQRLQIEMQSIYSMVNIPNSQSHPHEDFLCRIFFFHCSKQFVKCQPSCSTCLGRIVFNMSSCVWCYCGLTPSSSPTSSLPALETWSSPGKCAVISYVCAFGTKTR